MFVISPVKSMLMNIFNDPRTFPTIKSTPVFLLVCFTLISVGFSFNVFSFSQSLATYLLLVVFLNPRIHILEDFSNLKTMLVLPYSLISLLAFSESDFLRGLDAALLLAPLSLAGLTLLSEKNCRNALISSAFVISLSHSVYSVIIENFRTSGFISFINSIQFALSFLLLSIILHKISRKELIVKALFQIFSISISIGCFLVLTQSEKTDFQWDSMIWSTMIWSTTIFSFFWIFSNRYQISNNLMQINPSGLQIIIFSFILSAIFLLPGFSDDIETRKHVAYHLGLFNLFSENVVDSGPFHKCTDVVLPDGSSGFEVGEPGGCWVYPTAWWSFPVWALFPFVALGLDGIHSARFLSFLLRAICASMIGLTVKKYSINPSAPMIAIAAFVTSVQVSHYGRIYTWQQFDDIFILACIFLWWPVILEGKEKISERHWIATLIFSTTGPIIIGFTASAVCCFFALLYLIIGSERRNLRALVFTIILLSSISSWFIWEQALQYFYQDPNAMENYLLWKFERRTSMGSLLLTVKFWRELTVNSAYLLGPLLCVGFLILIATSRSFHPVSPEGEGQYRMEWIFSPFIFLWLIYTLLFPDVGFTHDYLGFWVIAPALSAIVGDFLSGIDKQVVIAILFAFILVTSNEYRHYDEEIYDPDLIQVQSWLSDNVYSDDSVLMSHDLYKKHYLAALSGRDIVHTFPTTNSAIVLSLIENEGIDKIITNSSGWSNWGLSELEQSGWCSYQLEGNDFTYIAMERC